MTSDPPLAAAPAAPGAGRRGLRWAFVGSNGLRAGWRFLLYNVLTILIALPFALWMKQRFHVGDDTPFTIDLLILIELVYLGAALIAMAVMARIERRRFADYGVPLGRMFGARFWEGTVWGVASIAAVALAVAALGGLTVTGLRGGPEVAHGALLWTIGCLLIGLQEEISNRGYQLATLRDGMGFWPGATTLALFFGWVLHYLEKPNETLMDGLNVSLVALFFCWTVRRTGDVWFAAGWHVTFNFTSFFIIGSPNTAFGGAVEPHWMQSSFAGPQWLTGGATGLEASVFATLVFALLFPAVAWRFGRGAAVGPAGGAEISAPAARARR